jgi:hypothetical protein
VIDLEYTTLPDIQRLEIWKTPSLENPGRRICVTGGRVYKKTKLTYERLNRIHLYEGGIREIGVGCAAGLDAMAKDWAEENMVSYRRYVADWDTIGIQAGAIRNGVMLMDFEPELLLGFPGGTGTTDCIRKARKMGIERTLFDDDSDPFLAAKRWG